MKCKILITFFILVVISTHGRADVIVCPWMNKATAADILNGDPSISVIVNSSGVANAMDNSTCKFNFVQNGQSSVLQVDVKALLDQGVISAQYAKDCVSSLEKLQAAGNEAYMCAVSGKNDAGMSMQGEHIVGRVRNYEFIITLLMSSQAGISMPDSDIKSKVLLAVGQVVGNLY